MGAREGEATDPGGNSLALVAIQVDKVLRTSIERDGPSRNVGVHESALGGIGELGQLGRSSDEAVVADGLAGKELGDGVRDTIGDDGGIRVGTRLVVEDADGDGVVGGSSRDAAGESQDGGSEDGGELHFEDCWLLVEEVGSRASVVKRQEI